MTASAEPGEVADGQLLARFALHHDDAAFHALLRRHGPMVLGVCRRILANAQDAEDAFQATFLVLVHKARSLRKPDSLGGWLYGVACRTARKARNTAARRRALEQKAPTRQVPDPLQEAAQRDLEAMLDEEVNRLPERYRVPFVLSHLEGKTHEEVARELGCPRETVTTRLVRARQRLRARLTRRGLAFSAGAAVLAVGQGARAAVPHPLVVATTGAARGLSGSGAVAPQLTALTKGVLQDMTTLKITRILLGFLVLGVCAGGLAITTAGWLAAEPASRPGKKAAKTLAKGRHGSLIKIPSRLDGVLLMAGTEIRKGERVPANEVVVVESTRGGNKSRQKYRLLNVGDRVEKGQLLARLDDTLAHNQCAIERAKFHASQADLKAAEALRGYYEAEYRRAQGLRAAKAKAISEAEFQIAEAQWVKAVQDATSKVEAVKLAELGLERAQIMLAMHDIRSPTRGVIKHIYKSAGEAVKKYDPVFAIQVARPHR
jgi:RNA polymerase sigma factor (sigma-70 family)